MTDPIRVIVCGDEGVGKSSLITSLVKDSFVPLLEHVLPPITIPREFSSIPDAPTNTVLVDTSSLLQDRPTLQKEIRRSHVIWLIYSDHYTCQRISLFWMPFFRSMGVNLPVVLTASKIDLNDGDPKVAIADEMLPILKEFKEIESCIRCSAKYHYNVNQAFYLCQRAVTHPLSPLFDSKEGNLKPAAVDALQRIFYLSDNDQDGYLNDSELLALQKSCFGKGLDPLEASQIKNGLNELGVDTSQGISLKGFLLLNKIFAQKGRHETTWGILRRFHYTDSLSLEDKFLVPHLDVPYNSSVELSPEGYRFLVDLFVLFDKDNDGGLSKAELDDLLRATPGIPKLWQETNFPASTVRNEVGNITLQGWLAQWSMTTYLDYKTTMSYLAYLGFENNKEQTRRIVDGVRITKARKKRNPRSKYYRTSTVVDRNVFNCFVVGSHGSGKSSLLNAFVNRPFSTLYVPTIKPATVVNSVEMPGGKQCYMILEELGELEPAVLENTTRLHECDVLCYTYDSSDPESFQYLVQLRQKYPKLDNLPAVFVGLKADLDRQQQRSDVQPDVYTRNLDMAAPLHVSIQWPSSLNELFVQLSEAAQIPGPATPRYNPDKQDSNEEQNSLPYMDDSTVITSIFAGAILSLVVVSVVVRRVWKD